MVERKHTEGWIASTVWHETIHLYSSMKADGERRILTARLNEVGTAVANDRCWREFGLNERER